MSGKPTGWIGAAILAIGACGGSTTGEESASGFPADTGVRDLSPTESSRLCEWYIEALGGDGASYACGSDVVVIHASEVECGEAPESCVATVGDVEACARDQRAAFEACKLDSEPPACARLARLCGDDDENNSDTKPVAAASCVPGAEIACACNDGSRGTQVCSDAGDGFTDCACQVATEPQCTSGQSESCVCADGSVGTRDCVDGAFEACTCETVGSCNVNFCPSTGSGTPCCVGPNGPCGIDEGTGCQPPIRPGVCDPDVCPSPGGGGLPCCLTPYGPCGVDFGMSCQ